MLINDTKKALKVLDQLKAYEAIVMDTETTGLEPFLGDRAIGYALKGVNLSDTSVVSKNYYFPVRHEVGINLDLVKVLPKLNEVLSDTKKIYIGFNYKFDLQIALQDGIEYPKHIEDVQILNHIMNENDKYLGLKALGVKHLGENEADEEAHLIDAIIEKGFCSEAHRKKAKGMMALLLPEEVAPYACKDLDLTWRLRNFWVEPLTWDDGTKASQLEVWGQVEQYKNTCEYLLCLARMERIGIKMSEKRLKKYRDLAEPRANHHKNKIRMITGRGELNPASPQQMQAVLGTKDCTKETLEHIIDTPEEFDPQVVAIAKHKMEFNVWSKAASSFYESYLELLATGRVIHPNFNICGTITTRLSCNNPNLQQVPRNAVEGAYTAIKKCFIARKGYTLVSIDYSQAEIILGANYSGDKALQDIILNGLNMHDITSKACNISRYAAKIINFGVDYGMQAGLLSKKLKIPQNTAKKYLDKYWNQFKGKHILFKACANKAEEAGYIVLWDGRILHFNTPDRPAYAAMNALIQGGIARIMEYVTLRLFRWIDAMELHDLVRVLLQVHDQILFEVKTEYLDKYIPKIVEIMEGLPKVNELGEELPFKIPMRGDVSIGPSWGELIEWKA